MAILEKDFGSQYLSDYYNDRIQLGLGMDIAEVDEYVSFKQGQYNIVIGMDNVGKTDVLLWYFLVMALKHGKKTTIWSGENKPEQQKRKLIQMYAGQELKEIPFVKVNEYKKVIENYFSWIDINKLYDHNELINIFLKDDSDICWIDPINGLNHKSDFGTTKMTYKFSNDVRQFCNVTNKTVFVSAHTVTEASRRQYPKGHELHDYVMPPIKSHIEGGQPFASRADDFWIIHRLTDHEQLWPYTQLEIKKVKDTETGGRQTFKDKPICFDFNKGLGYRYTNINILDPSTFYGEKIDPLQNLRPRKIIVEKPKELILTPNFDFDKILPVDEEIQPF